MKVAAITVSLLVIFAIGLTVTGYGGQLLFMAFTAYSKPSGEFNPDNAVAAPDYSLQDNWAALPELDDPADLVPAGVTALPQGEHSVDTFFIHPTGFLRGADWNWAMDSSTGTEENTKWMMANQASSYNGILIKIVHWHFSRTTPDAGTDWTTN